MLKKIPRMDQNESALWVNTTLIPQSKKKRQNSVSLASIDFRGAPDRTRTYNPQLRRLMLYPVELRAQEIVDCIIAPEKLNQSLFKQIVLLSS